ncbi:hypothetical protein [Vreelandella populi]|uniref:hypothetical protein n=1 Tax=Vreelandella populi TaxID=2498858 RepID=UPI000F8E5F64|nr:hypothetical protein [Halomonas populi]RUR57982.1 hypothetical protein ELY40_00110 [Halomonas populi]
MNKQDIFNDQAVFVSNAKEIVQQSFIDNLCRFNVETNSFKYCCLLRKSKFKSKKLYVFLHGAKDREKNKPPYFDRWSWNEIFDGHMLSFSDPTLQLNEKLGLAWYAGNDAEHPLDTIVEIVEGLANELSVDKSDVVFWGSSGGGFASIYSSLKLDGSKAVAFNPQTNALHYHERHVKRYLKAGFDLDSVDDLQQTVLQRMEIPSHYLKNTKSQIVVFQNTKDNFHYKNHYIRLKERLEKERVGSFKFYKYADDRGHGPESKNMAKEVVDNIKDVFSGNYKVKENYEKEVVFDDFYLKTFLNDTKRKSADAYLDILRKIDLNYKSVSSEFVEKIYIDAISNYPGGWSIKFWYASYNRKVGNIFLAFKVLLEVVDKFKKTNSSLPDKVVHDIKNISRLLTFDDLQAILNDESNVAAGIKDVELLFQSGFVLFKNDVEIKNHLIFRNWVEYKVNDYNLRLHPSTKYYKFESNDNSVIVLGDVYNSVNDFSVKECLVSVIEDNEWEFLDYLSGRFAVLVINGETARVFHDPFGSRTIFYSLDKQVVSSHSTLLAYTIGEPVDEKAIDFMKSKEYRLRGTVYLPGDSTVYRSIKGLMPNNYLKLPSLQTKRFWPRESFITEPLDDFLNKVDVYFKKTSDYIAREGYSPVLGLTAGVDSRAIIAGLKFYNQTPSLITWSRLPDNEVPVVEKMKRHLSLPHAYVDNKNFPSSRRAILCMVSAKYNAGVYRDVSVLTGQMQEQVEVSHGLFIRGLGGEICRGFYNRNRYDVDVNDLVVSLSSLYLTRKLDINEINPSFRDFVFDSIEGFVERGNYKEDLKGYDVLDLYYWEQRMGMWAANLLNEMDSAIADFVGLNSRVVYKSAMALSKEKRIGSQLMLDITQKYDSTFAHIDYKS